MGVYIKGMNMPKNCGYCRFCFEEDVMFETEFKCDLTGKFINGDYEGNFPDDCPLVEVPEPHGDLIDKDNICFSMTNGIDQDIAEEAIRESITVIEAEGE